MSIHDNTANPLVSVVIPSFNSARWIKETLQSVFNQSYPHIEIIVVDDGSTDESPSIIAPLLDRIKYIRQDNSGGSSLPRNVGIQQANGEYVSFLDADDLFHPQKIEHQIQFLIEHNSVGAVFGDYVNFQDIENQSIRHFQTCPRIKRLLDTIDNSGELILSSTACRRILSIENFTIASSSLIRKSILSEIGGFSQNLKGSEDFDLHYKIARQYDVGVINKIVLYRRIHNDNKTNNRKRALSQIIKSRNHLLRDEHDAISRMNIRRSIANAHLDLGNLLSGQENWQSLLHTFKSMKYRHPIHYDFMRNMAKACLSALRLR